MCHLQGGAEKKRNINDLQKCSSALVLSVYISDKGSSGDRKSKTSLLILGILCDVIILCLG